MSSKIDEIRKFAKRVLLNLSCLECYHHTLPGNYESHQDGAKSLQLLLEENDYSIDKIIDIKIIKFFEKWNKYYDPQSPKLIDMTDKDEIIDTMNDLFDIFISSFDIRVLACIDEQMIYCKEFSEIMEL